MNLNTTQFESGPFFQYIVSGTQAEFRGDIAAASDCYQQAWQLVRDDYESCIVAHYLARVQSNPADQLQWNFNALQFALRLEDQRIASFLPSLYLALGQSYELNDDPQTAAHYFAVAEKLGIHHDEQNNTAWMLIQAHSK